MKTSEQLSRVDDSDIYFAVTIILLAFDKNVFAIRNSSLIFTEVVPDKISFILSGFI